jgi:hypothetical protein
MQETAVALVLDSGVYLVVEIANEGVLGDERRRHANVLGALTGEQSNQTWSLPVSYAVSENAVHLVESVGLVGLEPVVQLPGPGGELLRVSGKDGEAFGASVQVGSLGGREIGQFGTRQTPCVLCESRQLLAKAVGVLCTQ